MRSPPFPQLEWFEPEEFHLWRRRLELERRAGNLTALRRDALRELLAFSGEAGLFPSDATVAKAGGMSARTVRRARADARALGLLDWTPTRKAGGRQGPNRYRVILPAKPVIPGGQRDRQGKSKEVRGLTGGCRTAAVSPADRSTAIAALEARRAEMDARTLAAIAAKAAARAARWGAKTSPGW